MGSYGECKLCGEKICYTPANVAVLGIHLLDKHPELEIAHFSLFYDPVPGCKCGCGCTCNHPQCSQRMKSRAIKTTIESWKKAQNPITCPKCKKTSVPLIRRQRHKLSKSTLGAFVLLGCWPICFLPFILGGSDLMYLYCKDCGQYLGMYDRRVAQRGDALCRMNHPERTANLCTCE